MSEFVDVIIVGAGLSGVSAAWHLQERCPGKSYVILERRADLGGTWDLFKYPGIRSDSDMFTLGFRFKPWESAQSIVEGPKIKEYIREAAVENGIDKHIRYGHSVTAADWSDDEGRWNVTVEVDGELRTISGTFLFACSGYYNYDEGYAPKFEGSEDFEGTIVHPQHWPTDLDYADRKIVVIGSGATAVTLIPALIKTGAGHVTMLQRTPTYIGSLPEVDPIAEKVNKALPVKLAHSVNRWKAITFATAQYQFARRFPDRYKQTLRAMAERRLPTGFDYDKHFSPSYKPWDQRVCVAPNGDLFKTIKRGKADVVTATIDKFTRNGILLTNGEEIEADIIVTATGLNMRLFGGAAVSRNGETVELPETMAYKGMMLTGLPNMAFTIGYTNASWTLKADLVSEFVCRVLNHMDEHGYATVEPTHPGSSVAEQPIMDFTPGYILRVLDQLPKAGDRLPWRLKQNYFLDIRLIRQGKIDDGVLRFSRQKAPVLV